MKKVRTTVYVDADTDLALRDYARRHRISIGEANNQLLRRALFDSLDEGTEAMLVPEIRKAVAAAAAREIREHVTRLLEAQTNRLAALLVTSGRDAFVARKLARDCFEDLTDDPRGADEREQDAWLKSRTRYTRDGLRQATAGPQG
ncbi:MAG: hypothetical protein M3R38_22195 [Actinomycetota bacterium]|nr:hypothetical protein [Actinomycetota bacterium]